MIKFFVIMTLLVLQNCEDPCAETVIEQGVNKKGSFKFVYVVRDCGATTDYSHKVYVLPAKNSYKDHSEEFRADKVKGLAIKWLSNNDLQIKYETARIFFFSNFWSNANETISIQLQQGT